MNTALTSHVMRTLLQALEGAVGPAAGRQLLDAALEEGGHSAAPTDRMELRSFVDVALRNTLRARLGPAFAGAVLSEIRLSLSLRSARPGELRRVRPPSGRRSTVPARRAPHSSRSPRGDGARAPRSLTPRKGMERDSVTPPTAPSLRTLPQGSEHLAAPRLPHDLAHMVRAEQERSTARPARVSAEPTAAPRQPAAREAADALELDLGAALRAEGIDEPATAPLDHRQSAPTRADLRRQRVTRPVLVLVVSADPALLESLGRGLSPGSCAEQVSGPVSLVRRIDSAGRPVVVVLDCARPSIDPTVFGAIAAELDTPVVLCRADARTAESLRSLSDRAARWSSCPAEPAAALAAHCERAIS